MWVCFASDHRTIESGCAIENREELFPLRVQLRDDVPHALERLSADGNREDERPLQLSLSAVLAFPENFCDYFTQHSKQRTLRNERLDELISADEEWKQIQQLQHALRLRLAVLAQLPGHLEQTRHGLRHLAAYATVDLLGVYRVVLCDL